MCAATLFDPPTQSHLYRWTLRHHECISNPQRVLLTHAKQLELTVRRCAVSLSLRLSVRPGMSVRLSFCLFCSSPNFYFHFYCSYFQLTCDLKCELVERVMRQGQGPRAREGHVELKPDAQGMGVPVPLSSRYWAPVLK